MLEEHRIWIWLANYLHLHVHVQEQGITKGDGLERCTSNIVDGVGTLGQQLFLQLHDHRCQSPIWIWLVNYLHLHYRYSQHGAGWRL